MIKDAMRSQNRTRKFANGFELAHLSGVSAFPFKTWGGRKFSFFLKRRSQNLRPAPVAHGGHSGFETVFKFWCPGNRIGIRPAAPFPWVWQCLGVERAVGHVSMAGFRPSPYRGLPWRSAVGSPRPNRCFTAERMGWAWGCAPGACGVVASLASVVANQAAPLHGCRYRGAFVPFPGFHPDLATQPRHTALGWNRR